MIRSWNPFVVRIVLASVLSNAACAAPIACDTHSSWYCWLVSWLVSGHANALWWNGWTDRVPGQYKGWYWSLLRCCRRARKPHKYGAEIPRLCESGLFLEPLKLTNSELRSFALGNGMSKVGQTSETNPPRSLFHSCRHRTESGRQFCSKPALTLYSWCFVKAGSWP